MQWLKAHKIAQKYIDQLRPFCERIEIAGSLRRKMSEVHDIEIVCIPKREGSDMFGGDPVAVKEFCDVLDSLQYVRGQATGRMACRNTPEGINIDFFMCYEWNWGYIMAIRTGPAGFSKNILVKKAKKNGLTLKNGAVYGGTGLLPVKEEKEFFERCGMEYILPEYRISVA